MAPPETPGETPDPTKGSVAERARAAAEIAARKALPGQGTMATVTERLTRTGTGIEYSAVVNDPDVLAEPWKLRPRRLTLLDAEMSEPAPCFDQDMQHMVDDSYHANPR